MAPEPQHRDQAAPLDAKLVPVRDALIARAKALETMANSDAAASSDPAEARVMARLSTEFRELASELHHW